MLEDELTQDPPEACRAWLRDAEAAGIDEPWCACLATASPDGAPSARMVLVRGFEGDCFHFFTDYRSRKAQELDVNPRGALVFHWHILHRQLRVEGDVERLSAQASDRYFLSRPRSARISAWASRQSARIDDRAALERQWAEVERGFDGREVVRPEHWGGYGLRAARIEFWRGSEHRLHDRVLFRRVGAAWVRERLQP